MSKAYTYRLPILHLLLAAILMMCFSSMYANDNNALLNSGEEVETMEMKDNVEEDKEFSNYDLDKDDALLSIASPIIQTSYYYYSDQKNMALFNCYLGIVLPPPES
jgi:hypothetical protein